MRCPLWTPANTAIPSAGKASPATSQKAMKVCQRSSMTAR
jgi:hypothetical protein